jgi:hypothetical protein
VIEGYLSVILSGLVTGFTIVKYVLQLVLMILSAGNEQRLASCFLDSGL